MAHFTPFIRMIAQQIITLPYHCRQAMLSDTGLHAEKDALSKKTRGIAAAG
ncbi:MAG: hypothetical protein H6938_09000 [Burkholderiales bacterium]|uniref:hypothetical protein n=1 Tax=Nitrosomonas sp. TaxID=42353 RepID=UPI001D39B8A9|nr:hypothetical protein [Nitrosomonas sp.]MCB1948082.1 hypothetical protein [Nitrosomonas sp.]MCP5292650.1 hypothetical protein [Burkholderiales bacterium]